VEVTKVPVIETPFPLARGADTDVKCMHLLGTLAAMEAAEVTVPREEAEREELDRERHRAERRSRMEVLFLTRPVEQVKIRVCRFAFANNPPCVGHSLDLFPCSVEAKSFPWVRA